MTMPAEPTKGESKYFIDAESLAEMGRLLRLEAMMTDCMEGLFPDHPDLASAWRVLDVACGPGAWASEMAYTYPEMEVFGVDISNTMIQYAQVQAKVQKLGNLHFQVMDATEPLKFPDSSFDLVNARLIDGFMVREAWPKTIREFVRVARPGGIIRITETDTWGLSNSFALEKLISMNVRALYLNGRTFSPYPHAQHLGVTPMLGQFFREAGCQDIQTKPYVLDFSAGAKGHLNTYENYKIAFKLLQPFVIKAKVATQEELDALYKQMLAEMMSNDFRGIVYFLSVWGYKPE